MTRPRLRLPRHRGTTAHVASVYPFSVQAGFGYRGPYIGVDVLAGGAEFCWDPFEAYAAGLVTNPNCWVFGEPGNGKSALIKTLIWRMAALYGDDRWFAIADPKGEYIGIAERLGLSIVRLAPGGSCRLNPLAAGPAASAESRDRRVGRAAQMVVALVATMLARPLDSEEDAIVYAAVDDTLAGERGEPTLNDVAARLASPTPPMTARLRCRPEQAEARARAAAFAIDKLLSRGLKGMFDGPSTIPLRWDGPGIVLDLSAVHRDRDALPLVMVAAAAWLQELMVGPGPQRIQVLDEAWALLANAHTARHIQDCIKLGSTYGVANICIAHRPSDLGAQADDGTATAKIASGLVADAATRIILRQAPDQLALAGAAFGLTPPEQELVGALVRARALWRVGSRTAVVHHQLAPSEAAFCDTDARMRATGAIAA